MVGHFDPGQDSAGLELERSFYKKFMILHRLFLGCCLQGSGDVSDQIFRLFQADAETHQAGIDVRRPNPGPVRRRKNLWVALSFVSNLAILFFFKYFNFAADSLVRILSAAGVHAAVPRFDVILPVGISFYTFQALGYTVDVYRREVRPEKNFFKYALFVSFFPQLVAGPIERSGNLLRQIDEVHRPDFDRIRDGLMMMLYGYFQKVVLAEYLGIAVDHVFDSWETATGFQLAAAAVCFAFQIYCDFASYSGIAIGAAKVMGFRLMENFDTPYLSRSVAEFWRRWHISLSTWLRDYLYIPLGGNRRGTVRRRINLMIVFLVSGLWHGASWHFVIWGGLNGIWQIAGEWLRPVRERAVRLFGVDVNTASHKLLNILTTFILIDISWVFFRADSFRIALCILKRIFGIGIPGHWFTWGNNLSTMGLSPAQAQVLAVSLCILAFADLCRYRGIVIRRWIAAQGLWLRWLLCLAAVFGVLIFGVYGPGYDASAFIYFQF